MATPPNTHAATRKTNEVSRQERARREMARTWALIYGFGGSVDLVGATLPHSGERDLAGLVVPGALAVGVAILIAVAGRRLAGAFYWALAPLAVALVSVGTASASPSGVAVMAMFYFWILLPTFYFFPFFWGVVNVAMAALLYAVILAVTSPPEPAFKWMMVTATMLVGGALLGSLRRSATQARGEREQLLERVEQLARTDELTGLPNRRAWDEELARELARAARHDLGLVVAILDLDHFKRFNDTHGHPAGDAFLREAAAAWRLCLRTSDLIARYGGEEFGVLLPRCPPAEAVEIIERLRATMSRGETCSAGIAHWDGEEGEGDLLERADAALYEAKATGRNRSVTARATPSAPGRRANAS